MIKNLKKAFTIIELVIVIAVIAILAAVMIPTYSSLVDKANQSADIQAVKQMNTILSTYVDGSITNISEAIIALDKDNIDLEDYKPLQKDRYFYFYMDGKTPKVVYADANDKAIYPENANINNVQLMSLSGDVPTNDSWKENLSEDSKTVSISSGAQFVDFMNQYVDKSPKTSNVTTINLSDNIDLKGTTSSFSEVTSNITLNGNNYTIKGLRADSNAIAGTFLNEAKKYGFGLFNKVPSGKTVTINNLNIENVVINDTNKETTKIGQSAVLFGTVVGTAVVESVKISNCDVYGGDKAGAIIGYLSGKATLKDIEVKNTNVYGTSFVAKLIGCVTQSANVDFSGEINADLVQTAINTSIWSKMWANDENENTNWLTSEYVTIDDIKTYNPAKPENTYAPWINPNGSNTWQFLAITTTDYYWIDNSVYEKVDDIYVVRKGLAISIEGKTGGIKLSGSTNYPNA